MRYLMLILAACTSVKNPPPEPTETTAMFFFTDYMSAYEVRAIDVQTHEGGTVLEPEDLPNGADAFVRAFGQLMYVVTRNFNGQGNGVSVIAPTQNYAVLKQFALPDDSNPADFWAVSEDKAYVIFTPFNASAANLRNALMIVNPTTGETVKTIDLEAKMKEIGVDLAAEDPDGSFELSALHADDQNLFISMQVYDQSAFPFVPRTNASECGFVSGAVAVVDIDADVLVDVIRLKGANPFGRFVTELGTDNLLISTVGNLSAPSVEPCNGIERINQRTLTLGEPYLTETQVNGTIASFNVGADGIGLGFILRGTTDDPDYAVNRFDTRGTIGTPLYAPGPNGFTFSGTIARTDRGEAYVGLPYATKAPELHVLNLSTGEQLDTISLTALPADIALYPGTAYSR